MAGELIEKALPEGLKAELMPKHVAVIMDGNRRWARERGMDAIYGYREAQHTLNDLIDISGKWGIKVLSVFAFSTENWRRSEEELFGLMSLFEDSIAAFCEDDSKWHNVRISFIGDRSPSSKLPESMVEKMKLTEEKRKGNTGLHVVLAINYSGQQDMMEATKSIAAKVKDGTLQIEDINGTLISDELQTNCVEFPMPDLLIRTSGEQRISNYMLWQLAYTELYFPQIKFTDFGEDDYLQALISFQKRDRRFGGKMYK